MEVKGVEIIQDRTIGPRFRISNQLGVQGRRRLDVYVWHKSPVEDYGKIFSWI